MHTSKKLNDIQVGLTQRNPYLDTHHKLLKTKDQEKNLEVTREK